MDVFDRTVNGAAVPLKATAVAPKKLFPVTVTVVPRPPVIGEKAVRVGAAINVNVAPTVLAPSIVTTHAPVPIQAPDQPANVEPVDATGTNVTWVP